MSEPYLVTQDFTEDLKKVLKSFRQDDILVGIPEAEGAREEGGPIGNAALLAINEFGSPQNNIPARPVMAIGLRNAQPEIIALFKQAATRALKEGAKVLPAIYTRIGIVASNSVKKAINAQEGIDPPAEATLAARRSQGFKGTKALIVTGQLRNAITFVLRGEG